MFLWSNLILGILWIAISVLKFKIAGFPEYANVRKWSLAEAWSTLALGFIQIAVFCTCLKR